MGILELLMGRGQGAQNAAFRPDSPQPELPFKSIGPPGPEGWYQGPSYPPFDQRIMEWLKTLPSKPQPNEPGPGLAKPMPPWAPPGDDIIPGSPGRPWPKMGEPGYLESRRRVRPDTYQGGPMPAPETYNDVPMAPPVDRSRPDRPPSQNVGPPPRTYNDVPMAPPVDRSPPSRDPSQMPYGGEGPMGDVIREMMKRQKEKKFDPERYRDPGWVAPRTPGWKYIRPPEGQEVRYDNPTGGPQPYWSYKPGPHQRRQPEAQMPEGWQPIGPEGREPEPPPWQPKPLWQLPRRIKRQMV